jgi:hypothetical protein
VGVAPVGEGGEDAVEGVGVAGFAGEAEAEGGFSGEGGLETGGLEAFEEQEFVGDVAGLEAEVEGAVAEGGGAGGLGEGEAAGGDAAGPGVVGAVLGGIESLRAAGHEDPGFAGGERGLVDVAEEPAVDGLGAEAGAGEGGVGGGADVGVAVDEGEGGESVGGRRGEVGDGVVVDLALGEGPADEAEGGASGVFEHEGFPVAALSE